MKLILLNPPYPRSLVRRYSCSYETTGYLLPPLELQYLAAGAHAAGIDHQFIDAVALGLDPGETVRKIVALGPRWLLAITGLESFGHDAEFLRTLGRAAPGLRIGIMGHYPTVLPGPALEAAGALTAVMGEPDAAVLELLADDDEDRQRRVPGTAWGGTAPVVNPPRQRILDLDSLPEPRREPGPYSEPFAPTPFTTMLASRGCDQACAFCVRTYGGRTARSAPGVLEEWNRLAAAGYRRVRFMDDSFTAQPEWALELARGLARGGPAMTWSALARGDELDAELLRGLAAAGLRRLYIGVESGSEELLRRIGKPLDFSALTAGFGLARKLGVETAAWFMVGHPDETDRDFEASTALARRLDPDFVMAGRFIPYPGTRFFQQWAAEIDFSLYPYRNEFRDPAVGRRARARARAFYRDFYLRPASIRLVPMLFRFPSTAVRMALESVSYQARGGRGGDDIRI